MTLTRKHARRGLDPKLVERFASAAAKLCAPLDDPSPWTVAMAAEPPAHRIADADAIDEGLLAIARFTDLKCRYTRGHWSGSRRSRARRRRSSASRRIARTTCFARAWCTTSAAWPSPPASGTRHSRSPTRSASAFGSIRTSASAFSLRAPALSAVAEIATAAHERLDGTGYHRRLPAAACTPAARVLSASDVYQALREDRPHRASIDAERAADRAHQHGASGVSVSGRRRRGARLGGARRAHTGQAERADQSRGRGAAATFRAVSPTRR